MDTQKTPISSSGHGPSPMTAKGGRLETVLVCLLFRAERLLLYLVAGILLALGIGIVVFHIVETVYSDALWPERFLVILEGLLLTLIVVEIFVTVMAHIRGERLRLEPFIIVGIIAVIRHILGIVVRLSVPMPQAEAQRQLIELSANAGVAVLLVGALALARWSQRSVEA